MINEIIEVQKSGLVTSEPVPIDDKKLNKVSTLRDSILEEALSKMKDSSLLTIKDLKDLESIASSVQSSIKPEDHRTQVNVMIQNILDSVADDC